MLNRQTWITKKERRGFTLIELLVVIAIISLLLSIVVPSLRLAKMKASSVVCLTNTKNMSLAWYTYQSDNSGRIMSARMDGMANGTYVGWIGAPYRNTEGDLHNTAANTPPITKEDAIRGIKLGRLHEYVDSPESYNCPGDTLRKSVYDHVTPFVSYSMARYLHWQPDRNADSYRYQVTQFGNITSPSSRYVFVEVAQERNWNQSGWFSFGAPEYTDGVRWGWWDPIAINHGDSSIVGFVDGHAETRRWQDSFTRERVEKLSKTGSATYDIEYPPAGQTEDIGYMARGWGYRYRP